jgi:hypothetical protein
LVPGTKHPALKNAKNLNADIYTTNKLVSTISIFGDTVNTAARMEQTCLPYMVHLTRDAAIRLVEEIDMSAEDEEEKITQDSIPWSEMQVSAFEVWCPLFCASRFGNGSDRFFLIAFKSWNDQGMTCILDQRLDDLPV